MKIAILLSVFAGVALCSPLQQEEALKNVVGNFVNCMSSDLSLCLQEHALRATERLGGVRSLKISDSLTFINTGDAKQARSLEPLSSEPEERKQQVTQRLWQSTSELIQNAEIEFSYGPEEEDSSRALGDVSEARGKKKDVKKKLKMLIPLAILAKIKAGALAILFLGIIAISLFKIAAILKLAFLAKLFSLLKTLLAKKHEDDHHSWAIPHHEEHHGHGWDSGASQGWSRSQRNDAQSLAYAAHRK